MPRVHYLMQPLIKIYVVVHMYSNLKCKLWWPWINKNSLYEDTKQTDD